MVNPRLLMHSPHSLLKRWVSAAAALSRQIFYGGMSGFFSGKIAGIFVRRGNLNREFFGMGGFLASADGLSGRSVRGTAAPSLEPEGVAQATPHGLDETVRAAADDVLRALDLTSQAITQAIDVASDKAFESAAKVSALPAGNGNLTHQTAGFSWGGYLQALGILGILLAALWFGVWALRKYGKFNFLPRPGALPKGALTMEAQLPLGPRKGLMVVRFLNKRLLLGVTEQQITLLTEEEATNVSKKSNFQDIMREAGRTDAGSDGNSGSHLS